MKLVSQVLQKQFFDHKKNKSNDNLTKTFIYICDEIPVLTKKNRKIKMRIAPDDKSSISCFDSNLQLKIIKFINQLQLAKVDHFSMANFYVKE